MKNKAIGIDLGGTFIKAGLAGSDGSLIKKRQFPTKAELGSRDKVLEQMFIAVEYATEDCQSDIAGIGIGTPGLVDKNGIVYESPNLPGWENLDLKRIFEERFGLPVSVENDVNTIAWGEYLYGAGRGANTMICITLGTGLGGGVVKDGRLLRGGKYSAVEIGHVTINYKGPRCKCGNFGCIERYVGRDYIVERAVDAIKQGKTTIIGDLAGNRTESITPQIISEAYKKGDKVAETIWKDVGECLGAMFADMVNIFNPDIIVIGGGISQAGDILFSSIKETIAERAIRKLAADLTDVVPSSLYADAGIISAAGLVFQN